jgi:hypothetical protein
MQEITSWIQADPGVLQKSLVGKSGFNIRPLLNLVRMGVVERTQAGRTFALTLTGKALE